MKRIICWVLHLIVLLVLVAPCSAQMLFSLTDGNGDPISSGYALQPGETVNMTLWVSNIPLPGLIRMGYSFVYNPTFFEIDATLPNATYIDNLYWPDRSLNELTAGKIDGFGSRVYFDPLIPENSVIKPPLSGDDIPLGTFALKKLTNGLAEFSLQERLVLGNDNLVHNPDDFVIARDTGTGALEYSLDSEISGGIVVGSITDPGDYDGDGDMDGEDLYLQASESCNAQCLTVQEFASLFGFAPAR